MDYTVLIMLKPFKIFRFLIACCFLNIAILCFTPLSIASVQEKERTLIKVAVDAEYQPYEYSSSNGLVHGFLPELLRAIAKYEALDFEFIPMSWPEAVKRLKQGEIDLVNMIYSKKRAREYLFSLPHSHISQALFRHKEHSNIEDLESLKGSIVAVQQNDIAIEKLKLFDKNDFHLSEFENKHDAFVALNAGYASALITAEQPGLLFLKKYPFESIELIKMGLWTQDFCFATRKNNSSLIEQLNRGLGKIKQNGEYKTIYKQWMIQPPTDWMLKHKDAFISLGLALFVVLIIIILWTLREIKNKEKLQRALAKLEKSEEKYRSTVESISDGLVVLLGEHFIINHFNYAAAQILQHSANDVLGKPLFEVFPKARNTLLEDKFNEVYQHHHPVFFEIHFKRQKGIIWFGIRAFAGKEGISVFFQDITQQKKDTQKLNKLNKELERLSFLDGLTGIANRRMFDINFEREWEHAVRFKAPLALIIIDIDYFKQYNDTYGHIAGDKCLKTIAGVISQVPQRSVDIVARYGGEEFVIVLPSTEIEEAINIAKQSINSVREACILHEPSDINDHVTISAGVAVMTPESNDDRKTLIASADQALYQAKQAGRNQYRWLDLNNTTV